MEDKLKAFLRDIQGKLSEAISMCDGEEAEEESEDTQMSEPDDMPDDKALRKEKLKLKLKKELGA